MARCSSRFTRSPRERTFTGVWLVRMAPWPAFSLGTGTLHGALTPARDGTRPGGGTAFFIGRLDSRIVVPSLSRSSAAAVMTSDARGQVRLEGEIVGSRVLLPCGHGKPVAVLFRDEVG